MDKLTYFDNISIELDAQSFLEKVQLRGSQRGSEDFLFPFCYPFLPQYQVGMAKVVSLMAQLSTSLWRLDDD